MVVRGDSLKKIGLALSGGGVKSFSQLPVLKALDKENIKVDVVAGTSMGSVVAGFMAIGLPVDELIKEILDLEEEVEQTKIFSKRFLKMMSALRSRSSSGIVNGEVFEDILNERLKKYNVDKITDVKIPLAIPAVDIITGKIIVFVSHPEEFKSLDDNWVVVSDVSLAKAIRASSSFPFAIDACPFRDYMLTDGGVRMNLPLPLIDGYGVREKIAVTMHSEKNFDEFDSAVALGIRFMELGFIEQDGYLLKDADVVINVPLEGVWVFEVGKGRYTMNQGAKVVEGKVDALRELGREKNLFERLRERSLKK